MGLGISECMLGLPLNIQKCDIIGMNGLMAVGVKRGLSNLLFKLTKLCMRFVILFFFFFA